MDTTKKPVWKLVGRIWRSLKCIMMLQTFRRC